MKKKKSLLLFLAATSASFVQAAPPRPSENLDFLLFITVLRAYKAL